MFKTMTYIDKRFAVTNSGISCLAWIFNLSNPRTTILNAKNWFKVVRCDESYSFSKDQFEPVALWLEQQWVGGHGFESRRMMKLSAAPRPFGVVYARFYIAALSIILTPHSLFWDLGADNPLHNPLDRLHCRSRVQVWVQLVQVWAPADHLAITPEGYSRRQSKVLS